MKMLPDVHAFMYSSTSDVRIASLLKSAADVLLASVASQGLTVG
jgi:hypothetical protein